MRNILHIGRFQHIGESVFAIGRVTAEDYGKQVQIVIAKHRQRRVAQRAHEPDDVQRTGTAVDQISDQPESILTRI